VQQLKQDSSFSELYLPTVQRIGLLFLMTCATGLTYRLAVAHNPRAERSDVGEWQQLLLSNSAHERFFLDIGASGYSIGGSFSTRFLEQIGWRGVCADPFPRDLENRACKLVKLPVAQQSGNKVLLPDCSSQSDSLKRLFNQLIRGPEACPMVERSTLSVPDLLELVAAPRLIDFASLDTDGSELTILQAFPFDRACVRAWQVKHGLKEATMKGIRDILEPHNCSVKEGFDEFFIRCTCDDLLPSKLPRRGPIQTAIAADGTLIDSTHGQRKRLTRRVEKKKGVTQASLVLSQGAVSVA